MKTKFKMLAVSMAMVMALTACSGGGGNVASNTGKSSGGTEVVQRQAVPEVRQVKCQKRDFL